MAYRLTKHHGLGNDFLVLLGAPDDLRQIDGATARRWCDRRRGIGADGLLLGAVACSEGSGAAGSNGLQDVAAVSQGAAARVDPQRAEFLGAAGAAVSHGADAGPVALSGADAGALGADLVMTLFNADGSRAEMSGNGIRCLAQAEARRRGVEAVELHIATDAGMRTVNVRPGADPGDRASITATVDMGEATPGPEPDIALAGDPADLGTTEALVLSPRASTTLDLGNPHLVLLVTDPEAVDLVAAGSLHEAAYSGGINVHVIAPTPGERDALTIRVWERGVGVTDACGTGAVAAARAAHDWGLVGRDVTVHMPGGDVRVTVGDPMTLTGPATYVAAVEVCA